MPWGHLHMLVVTHSASKGGGQGGGHRLHCCKAARRFLGGMWVKARPRFPRLKPRIRPRQQQQLLLCDQDQGQTRADIGFLPYYPQWDQSPPPPPSLGSQKQSSTLTIKFPENTCCLLALQLQKTHGEETTRMERSHRAQISTWEGRFKV